MLQDSFGRRFYYLRLSITDVCNFRCNYCLPDGYKKDGQRSFLTRSEIVNLVSGFASAGTQKVRITGGEPALRKDLIDIIGDIKNIPGIQTVAMTTNGYRLGSLLQGLDDAGLDQLNVSIDSLDPQVFQTITGHDRLNEILAALQQAQMTGIKHIKVNAVLMRDLNDRELDTFLAWIKDQDLTLRFIEVMQTGDNTEFFEKRHLSGAALQVRLLEQGWQAIIRNHDAGPAVEYWHPDYQGRIGLIMPYSQDFCRSCNRLRVSAEGKVHLCLFGDHGYDIRHLIQQPEQRPQLTDFLSEVLKDKKVSHFLQQGHSGITRDLSMIGG
ncbi:GTP 3',8-cyclase MoaA [Gynuella sunshinyii]|uniref:GTP 3',8-cyclase n=1 Tax=Gynuella sunshinyii YC6258 TaxID=1445510 RepID=A0A0C5VTF1_9GAMM|nr:GTP 3',8-cyclase MoaA [Gynuella sunshinyii]AJQ93594.1 molybdenum cofactor biosynthesis enzyme [Gynuella sunshinyii YC6258]